MTSNPIDKYEYYRTNLGTLYYGDCLEIMPLLEDKIDMILCDLPYGITNNKWDNVILFNSLWKCYNKLVKNNSIVILTASQPFATDLINSNRNMFKYDLIYEKTLGSGFLNAKRMPMRYHEHLLVFYNKLPVYNPIMGKGIRKLGVNKSKTHGTNYGKKTKFNYIYDDKGSRYPKSIIRFSTGNRTSEQYHPTQKPVALFEYLIRTYTNKNDLVLDNCIGSGTTAVACERLGRRWIGIEISEEYCEIAKKRIEAESRQGKLDLDEVK